MSRQVRSALQLLAGVLGAGLGVAGLWYVFRYLSGADVTANLAALDGIQIAEISFLALGLALANLLIAKGWHDILSDFDVCLDLDRANEVFSQANLVKYVPGNILHLVGRQVLAMREGVPALAAAKSLSVETVLLVLTAGCFAGVVLIWSKFSDFGIVVAVALVCFLVGSLYLILRRLSLTGSARATIAYLTYHLVGGAAFGLLGWTSGP